MNLRDAEIAIARVLADLETSSEALVEDLRIESLDVTSMGDTRQQLKRRVVITLKPTPGSMWEGVPRDAPASQGSGGV